MKTASGSSRHARRTEKNRIVTTGKRYLKDDRWWDDNGPIPVSDAEWDPPMTEQEIMTAALSDPDAQPLTKAQLSRMRRISFAKHVRFILGLSQDEFSRRFGIPIGTLRDWEQHRTEPDTAALSYLKVIKANPKAVARALQPVG
ncbi:MAG: helix-turn-helix domain-containing protein [Hyphomicrobium sp.]